MVQHARHWMHHCWHVAVDCLLFFVWWINLNGNWLYPKYYRFSFLLHKLVRTLQAARTQLMLGKNQSINKTTIHKLFSWQLAHALSVEWNEMWNVKIGTVYHQADVIAYIENFWECSNVFVSLCQTCIEVAFPRWTSNGCVSLLMKARLLACLLGCTCNWMAQTHTKRHAKWERTNFFQSGVLQYAYMCSIVLSNDSITYLSIYYSVDSTHASVLLSQSNLIDRLGSITPFTNNSSVSNAQRICQWKLFYPSVIYKCQKISIIFYFK